MRKIAVILVLALLGLSGLACNLLNMAEQAATAEAFLPATVTPTLTALPSITPLPTPTAVWLPPTAIPTITPYYTPTPFFTATPAPARIRFATGATSATLGGQPIGTGGTQQYVINAMAGQMLIAALLPAAPETLPNMLLAVYTAEGALLGRTAPGAASWAGKLPATQDYRIVVQNAGPATAFALQVTIPRVVTFAAGETAATLSGSVSVPGVNSYVVEAGGGQPLQVDVITPGGNAWLAIRGVDGVALLGADARQVSWAGTLPSTQGYLVEVGAGTGTAEYTLRIVAPQRLSFAAGATSLRLNGSLAGPQDNTYVLEATAGQLMTVSVSAPETGNNVWLTIEGRDGTRLLALTDMSTTWTGRLPASQDYIITVVSSGSAARYSLYVEIARRIQFAPGATSVRLDGTLTQPEGVSFVLEARAGQTLSVSVAPADRVYLTVVGQDGSPLARYQASWSGVLPLSQDYSIMVGSAGGATGIGYALDVSVTG